MKAHVDLVGSLYIIWGMLSLLVGLALLSLGLGAAALAGQAGDEPIAPLGASLAALVFAMLAAVVLLWAIVHMANGRALKRHRPWARGATLVLGVLNLFLLPSGTALGLYTLWVLMHDDTRLLFERPRA